MKINFNRCYIKFYECIIYRLLSETRSFISGLDSTIEQESDKSEELHAIETDTFNNGPYLYIDGNEADRLMAEDVGNRMMSGNVGMIGTEEFPDEWGGSIPTFRYIYTFMLKLFGSMDPEKMLRGEMTEIGKWAYFDNQEILDAWLQEKGYFLEVPEGTTFLELIDLWMSDAWSYITEDGLFGLEIIDDTTKVFAGRASPVLKFVDWFTDRNFPILMEINDRNAASVASAMTVLLGGIRALAGKNKRFRESVDVYFAPIAESISMDVELYNSFDSPLDYIRSRQMAPETNPAISEALNSGVSPLSPSGQGEYRTYSRAESDPVVIEENSIVDVSLDMVDTAASAATGAISGIKSFFSDVSSFFGDIFGSDR